MIEIAPYSKETGAVFKDGELVFNNSGHADKWVAITYTEAGLSTRTVEEYLSSYKYNEVIKWLQENL